MDLKGYEQEKFAIADIIRSAQAIDTKDDALRSECRDLLTRLAEDRFNLLVVGRFIYNPVKLSSKLFAC